MDELDRAEIHPARRVRHQHDARVARQLARDHQLLLVAAGQLSGDGARVGRAHVEFLEQREGARREPPGWQERAYARRGLALAAEHQVLGERERRHHATPQAVARHVGESRPRVFGGRVAMDALPGDRQCAVGGAPQSGECFDQFALAIAFDARDADDLARAHIERHAAHGRQPAIIAHLELARFQQGSSGYLSGAHVHRRHRAAHHHGGDRFDRHVRGGGFTHDPACAHHRDVLGERLHLGELVGDQHDAGALALEFTQEHEQPIHFLRRQDRRGFVEDQHARAMAEGFQDLDALLFADRQR